MRTELLSCFVLSTLLGAAAANAQDNGGGAYDGQAQTDTDLPLFEITPFGGYRFGGNFDIASSTQDVSIDPHASMSLGLGLRIDEGSQYELFYGRQETRLEKASPYGPLALDIEYLHIGGTVISSYERRVQPYMVGGLGVTRFTPDVAGVTEETHFSLNVGGGLRVPFNEHFSLRFEARGFVTFMDAKSAIFCASGSQGGFCDIRGSGNAFFQYDFLAGAAFAF